MNQNNEVPTKLHAKLITVATIGAVGGFLFGYDTSVINGAVDAIASPDSGFGLNAAMSGFSVSSAMIGCVVGAWFAGTLADRIGRVRVMQLAAALFVFSALFTGLASNIWVFVIFRIVGGLGVGFTSAIGPAYISEISPSSRRGFLTGFQQMAIALGIVASLVVNDSYLLGSGGAAVTFWAGLETWRWMLMTTAVPGVIMFALTFALPESPRYLVMKGKKAIAEKVLLEVVGDRNASATVEQIAQSLEGETQPKVSDLRGKTFGLKSVVWIGIGVALFQQVSGANVIMFYDSSLWKAVGFTESASMTIAVVRALLATGRGGRLLRPIHDDRRWRHRAARCVGHHHDYRRLWVLPDLLRDVGRGDVGRHRRDLPEPHPRRCGGAGHRRQLDRQLPRLHHLPAAA